MKRTLLFGILYTLLFCNFQCNDCDDELHDSSSYMANIKPVQKTYNINDTINLGSSFSSAILLDLSKKTHDNSNREVSFVVQFLKIEPNNNKIIQGLGDFIINPTIGQPEESPYFSKRLATKIVSTCDSDSCRFSLQIIPQKIGVYCFSLLTSRMAGDECTHLYFIKNSFDLIDNNFAVCKEIDTKSIKLPLGALFQDPAKEEELYFFKVE